MEYIVQGANVLAFEKNNHKYAMSCSWTTHVDYEEVAMLLGSQSNSGNALEIGDLVGISALAQGQDKLAVHFGTSHSLITDKFKGIEIEQNDGAILIPGAKSKLICKVKYITHLEGNEIDRFVIFKVLKHEETIDAKFLIFQDLEY